MKMMNSSSCLWSLLMVLVCLMSLMSTSLPGGGVMAECEQSGDLLLCENGLISLFDPRRSPPRSPPRASPPPPRRSPPPPPRRSPPPPPRRSPPPPPRRSPPPPPRQSPPPPPRQSPPPPPRQSPPPPLRSPPPPPRGSPPPPWRSPPPSPPTSPSPPPPPPSEDLASLIPPEKFDELFPNRFDPHCDGHSIYTYEAFIESAESFPSFGQTGDIEIRKREIAAFLAQTAYETTRALNEVSYLTTWGYCYVEQRYNKTAYCDHSTEEFWPCVEGKRYYGRGPIQLKWNYNYGRAGEALDVDLLHEPDLVAEDAFISFKTAFWFWMTPRSQFRPFPIPSPHDVITGQWVPTAFDLGAGRLPGYGAITNIINGKDECGKGYNQYVQDRIYFYEVFSHLMHTTTGGNLDCFHQEPFTARYWSKSLMLKDDQVAIMKK